MPRHNHGGRSELTVLILLAVASSFFAHFDVMGGATAILNIFVFGAASFMVGRWVEKLTAMDRALARDKLLIALLQAQERLVRECVRLVEEGVDAERAWDALDHAMRCHGQVRASLREDDDV